MDRFVYMYFIFTCYKLAVYTVQSDLRIANMLPTGPTVVDCEICKFFDDIYPILPTKDKQMMSKFLQILTSDGLSFVSLEKMIDRKFQKKKND